MDLHKVASMSATPPIDLDLREQIAENAYLERHEPVITALTDEQSRVLDALAAQQINTKPDAVAVARLAIQLTEIDSTGAVHAQRRGLSLFPGGYLVRLRMIRSNLPSLLHNI